MFRKIYGVYQAELSTIVIVGGKPVRIEFSGGVPLGNSRISARYRTTDKNIQDAIEADPRYGSLFFLESISEIKKPERVVKNGKTREFKYITRFQDAVNVLVTEYHVPLENLTNKAEVKKAAEKKGVAFPNLR